ncbi:hypothetical protein ABPG72_007317 [Tetrahymena utriculariae]
MNQKMVQKINLSQIYIKLTPINSNKPEQFLASRLSQQFNNQQNGFWIKISEKQLNKETQQFIQNNSPKQMLKKNLQTNSLQISLSSIISQVRQEKSLNEIFEKINPQDNLSSNQIFNSNMLLDSQNATIQQENQPNQYEQFINSNDFAQNAVQNKFKLLENNMNL